MAGPQCCANPPNLSSSSHEAQAGCLIQVGGLKAYATGPSHCNLAIVLISDIFGYEAPHLRELADKVAAAGFYVLVPDFFYGDPFVFDIPERPLPVWLECHPLDKGFEDAKQVIAALRKEGKSSFGAAGFCWGGKVVADLAKTDYIQAGVLLHPFSVTVNDIKEVKDPIAILGAEFDEVTPSEILKQFEEVLSFKPEVASYFKIFPGVTHGWTTRYNEEDETAVKNAEKAHKIMLDWFVEYVK